MTEQPIGSHNLPMCPICGNDKFRHGSVCRLAARAAWVDLS